MDQPPDLHVFLMEGTDLVIICGTRVNVHAFTA
jgi:hypothetical protein